MTTMRYRLEAQDHAGQWVILAEVSEGMTIPLDRLVWETWLLQYSHLRVTHIGLVDGGNGQNRLGGETYEASNTVPEQEQG